jgi:thiamine pyrophosphokinase
LTNKGGGIAPPKSALVILNSPIRQPPSPLFDALWKNAAYRVCADGGANRLHKATRGKDYVPSLIRGDLDSLDDHVRDHYRQLGCVIERESDQNSNDLDKALTAVEREGYKSCCVYGAFGGRFDQEMGCFQALYKWDSRFDELWLYDDQTCAILLPADQNHEIYLVHSKEITDPTVPGEGPTCGLIPLSVPCDSVSTTGLQWNLENQHTAFGGLVSTSNRVVEDKVTVRNSHPLIFTAEVTSGSSCDLT